MAEEKKLSSESGKIENSKDTPPKEPSKTEPKKAKPVKAEGQNSEEPKDFFWGKALITTIILIWIALAVGSWIGNYVAKTHIMAQKESIERSEIRKPEAWKTVMQVDEKGRITKQATADTELLVDDFKNNDAPIPGMDDQPLKTPEPSMFPVQEPVSDEPPKLPEKSDKPTVDQENKITNKVTNKLPESAPKTDTAKTDSNTQFETSSDQITVSAPTATPTETKKEEPKKDVEKPRTPDSAPVDKSKESYTVQLGSYSQKENADKIATDLERKGYKPVIEKISSGSKEFYKVRLSGSSDSSVEAKSQIDKLKKDGFEPIIINH